MKILFEQLSPYTHKKDIAAYRRVEVITYQVSECMKMKDKLKVLM